MIDESEYTVRYRADLPVAAGGMILESPDGHINIYLNPCYNDVMQRVHLDHELEHAERDDLHSGKDIREIEGALGIPGLKRAIDLLPKNPPVRMTPTHSIRFDASHTPTPPAHIPPEETRPARAHLEPYQLRAVMNAISDLDRCFFGDTDRMLALMGY